MRQLIELVPYYRGKGWNAAVTAVSELPKAQIFSSPRFSPNVVDTLDLVWPAGAPLLESFCMDLGAVCHISDHFTNGTLPKLRRVKIVDCKFRWSMNFLGNLTYLAVSTNHSSWTQLEYPDVKEILDILSKLNELRELHLTMSTYELSHSPTTLIATSGLIRVKLPHLQVLELGLRADMVTALLMHLPCPQTKLTISCKFDTPNGISVVITYIQTFCSIQLSKGRRIEAAHIATGFGSGRTLYLWDPSDCEVALCLFLYFADASLTDYFALTGPLLVQQTKYISVDILQDLQVASAYLPQCSIICDLGNYFSEISDLPQPALFESADGTLRFPSIKAFAISRVDFSQNPKTSRSLTRLTLSRFAAGLEAVAPWFSKLVFTNCRNFPEAQFTKLRRAIVIRNIESPDLSPMENLNLIIKTVAEDT